MYGIVRADSAIAPLVPPVVPLAAAAAAVVSVAEASPTGSLAIRISESRERCRHTSISSTLVLLLSSAKIGKSSVAHHGRKLSGCIGNLFIELGDLSIVKCLLCDHGVLCRGVGGQVRQLS